MMLWLRHTLLSVPCTQGLLICPIDEATPGTVALVRAALGQVCSGQRVFPRHRRLPQEPTGKLNRGTVGTTAPVPTVCNGHQWSPRDMTLLLIYCFGWRQGRGWDNCRGLHFAFPTMAALT